MPKRSARSLACAAPPQRVKRQVDEVDKVGSVQTLLYICRFLFDNFGAVEETKPLPPPHPPERSNCQVPMPLRSSAGSRRLPAISRPLLLPSHRPSRRASISPR
jgi:hypothetical protein